MIKKRRGAQLSSLILWTLLISPRQLSAPFEQNFTGARSGGLANAVSAMPGLVDHIAINPAGIHLPAKITTQFFYSRPYNLPNLKAILLQSVFTRSNVALGLSLGSFGTSTYNELSAIVAGSIHITQGSTIGGAVRYNRLAITRYGQAGALSFDVGFQAQLYSTLYWGSAIRNLSESKLGQSQEPLPQELLTGLSYRPINSLTVNLDICKEMAFPLDSRLGLEYKLGNHFFLRTAIASEPQRITFGFGVEKGLLGIDYAFNSHDDLGSAHLFTVRLRTLR